MKLKIKKTFRLANPKVWLPLWSFTKDQILETDDEYLIKRLFELEAAESIDKESTKKLEVEKNKMQTVIKNKALSPDKTTPAKRGRKPKNIDKESKDE